MYIKEETSIGLFEDSKITYRFLKFTHPDEGEDSPVLVESPPDWALLGHNIRVDLTLNNTLHFEKQKVPLTGKSAKIQRSFFVNIYKLLINEVGKYFKEALICFEYHASGVLHTHAIMNIKREDIVLPMLKNRLRVLGFDLKRCEVASIGSILDSIAYIKKSRTKYGDKLFYAVAKPEA